MLDTAIQAAREAGKVLLEGTRGEIEVERTAHRDIKLAMDKKAEQIILGILRQRFPEHAILSEEAGPVGPKSDYLWVIDPLDGTFNYSRRLPQWATSIALMRKGEEILGVVYDPLHEELFHAAQGAGAFLNGRPIRVSDRASLKDCTIAYGYSPNDEYLPKSLDATRNVTIQSTKVRAMGAAVLHLVYVACGRLDGFFEYGIHPWDIAAGSAIIREAGGAVRTRTHPNKYVDIVTTNGRVQDELMKQIGW